MSMLARTPLLTVGTCDIASLLLKFFMGLALLGRHGSDSLCRDERENKMAATYNVLAFKR